MLRGWRKLVWQMRQRRWVHTGRGLQGMQLRSWGAIFCHQATDGRRSAERDYKHYLRLRGWKIQRWVRGWVCEPESRWWHRERRFFNNCFDHGNLYFNMLNRVVPRYTGTFIFMLVCTIMYDKRRNLYKCIYNCTSSNRTKYLYPKVGFHRDLYLLLWNLKIFDNLISNLLYLYRVDHHLILLI